VKPVYCRNSRLLYRKLTSTMWFLICLLYCSNFVTPFPLFYLESTEDPLLVQVLSCVLFGPPNHGAKTYRSEQKKLMVEKIIITQIPQMLLWSKKKYISILLCHSKNGSITTQTGLAGDFVAKELVYCSKINHGCSKRFFYCSIIQKKKSDMIPPMRLTTERL
jgi:hypothetical protein